MNDFHQVRDSKSAQAAEDTRRKAPTGRCIPSASLWDDISIGRWMKVKLLGWRRWHVCSRLTKTTFDRRLSIYLIMPPSSLSHRSVSPAINSNVLLQDLTNPTISASSEKFGSFRSTGTWATDDQSDAPSALNRVHP